MKVNVSGILKNMDNIITVKDSMNIDSIDFKDEDMPVCAPIDVNASIINLGDRLHLEGKFKTCLILKCSRCLEEFNYNLEGDMEEDFSSEEKMEDCINFSGDVIDLTEVIINNILLSLPIKYVCSEDCKGLCPYCGRNNNIEKCDCSENNVDPRMEVLKKYFKGN